MLIRLTAKVSTTVFLLLSLSMVPALYAQNTFQRSDCNGNGSMDIGDVVSLLDYAFSGASEPVCIKACDSNDDGSINIADPVQNLGELFWGLVPYEPHAVCGADPTVDTLTCSTASTV